MNLDIERLTEQRETLVNQLQITKEKLNNIDGQIEKIRESCVHSEFNISKSKINVIDKEYDITIKQCLECGELILE
jgi:formylmethanofuran dehydrogenase subunit E